MKSRFLLLFITCISLLTSAQDTLRVDDPTLVFDINPFVEVFEMPAELTVQQVMREIVDRSAVSLEEKVNLGMVENSNYWILFTVENQTVQISKYLELQNPQMDLVRLYEVRGSTQIRLLYETGDNFRFAQRPVANRYFVFPLKLQRGETQQYLMQVEKQKSSVSFPMILYDDALYGGKVVREYVFLGLFFGILFLIAAISLVIGVFIRQKLFVVYGLYVTVFALWFFSREGFTYAFITSEYPKLNLHFYPMTTSATVVFLILYIQSFFKTRDLIPVFHQVMRFLVGFLALGFAYWVIFPDSVQENAPALFAVRYLILLLAIVFAYTAAINAFGIFPLRARLFLLGYSVFFLGIIVELLDEYGVINVHDFIIPPIMAGYFIEVVALTFAMGSIIFSIIKHKEELLVSNRSLTQAIENLENEKQEGEVAFITLKSKAVLEPEKIRYIRSDDHYLEYYLTDRDNPEVDRNKLSEVKKSLPPQFSQIHRSIIVNLTHVKSVYSDKIQLRGGEELRLSRTYRKDLEDRLNS